MPRFLSCLLLAVALAAPALRAADEAAPSAPAPAPAPSAPRLTKFNLDFPGGTPGELVTAIQKATGRPLNVIIRTEYLGRPIPALKLSGVDAAQLFAALSLASSHYERVANNYGMARFGFRTDGAPSDSSIWYFFVEEPPQPPAPVQFSEFFLLTPYLDRGLTVDDIATAIQTAAKMRTDLPPPTITFHKETKLLIAVGSGEALGLIRQALDALNPAPKPAEAPAKTPPAQKQP